MQRVARARDATGGSAFGGSVTAFLTGGTTSTAGPHATGKRTAKSTTLRTLQEYAILGGRGAPTCPQPFLLVPSAPHELPGPGPQVAPAALRGSGRAGPRFQDAGQCHRHGQGRTRLPVHGCARRR